MEFEFKPSYDELRKIMFVIKEVIDPICRKWDQEFSASCGYFSEFLRSIKVVNNPVNADMSERGQLIICRLEY